MWKYVTRRIRDTIERSANHFDRRSTTVVNNTNSTFEEKKTSPPCKWFPFRRCCNSYQNDDGTNSEKWNFDHLNRTWMGAITWSGAVVLGWYTSQLIHLRLKYYYRDGKTCTTHNWIPSNHPILASIKKNDLYLNSVSQIEKVVSGLTPTVHLMSNETYNHESPKSSGSDSSTNNSTPKSSSSSEDDLGEVLNSIENRLGLAAIENGQYQEGLNLLKSAANRHHAPAMYNLGLCYEMGLGVDVNEKTAMELYKAAAALDHPGALYNLGVYYGQGRGGLTSNHETATRLLRLAAVQGQQDAIDALKALDLNIIEPPHTDTIGPPTWGFQASPYLPCHDSILPTHTTLFVENVNFIQTQSTY